MKKKKMLHKKEEGQSVKKNQKKKLEDKELDRDLDDTFPASDPITHY